MNAYEYLKQGAIVPVTMDAIRDLVELGKQQEDRIAELEKDGKVCATCGGLVYDPILKQTKPENVWTSCVACGQRVTGDSIHTCSPQTKPLSDDEIEQLREYHGINDWLYETSVTDFARAIEERHGIK
jgi:hypothetical protein